MADSDADTAAGAATGFAGTGVGAALGTGAATALGAGVAGGGFAAVGSDAGVWAAAGSDFSPGPFAPLMGIQGMVTRTGWDGKTWGANQRITVDEALRVNTVNGAYNSHEEATKGSITAGKLADFVVLADDPHTVSAEKIKDIQIVKTVVGGATAYQG